jgi:TolB-like protein
MVRKFYAQRGGSGDIINPTFSYGGFSELWRTAQHRVGMVFMRVLSILLSFVFAIDCFAGATTQPVKEAPQIAVFSFVDIGPENQPWIAQAIEENFIAELSRGGSLWPVRAISQSKDQSDAMTTARNSGAKYMLTGAYQMVGDQMRVTGQIVAANDGHVIGGLTATGSTRDLFTIEDILTAQAKRLLIPPSTPVVIGQPIAPSGPVAVNGPTVSNDFSASAYQPAVTFLPQYNQYYYYSTPYIYSGWGYGLGGGFGGYGGLRVNGAGRGFGGFGHIGWGGSGGGQHSIPW